MLIGYVPKFPFLFTVFVLKARLWKQFFEALLWFFKCLQDFKIELKEAEFATTLSWKYISVALGTKLHKSISTTVLLFLHDKDKVYLVNLSNHSVLKKWFRKSTWLSYQCMTHQLLSLALWFNVNSRLSNIILCSNNKWSINLSTATFDS